ncbi:Protein of unknown function [Variovorax sp. HW608]|uniref:DUF3024 domain-containing protein n=1 Tax=Variovorax sp. HW608 TaxID=1034889 RepID=UPI00081F9DC5|nr:hypothetical protein [Variovorax sp. HW608]SCK18040.1 Protein of unknown function [Variovorax sp. HW608]
MTPATDPLRASALPPAAGQLLDVTRVRLERALRQRVRYRYVQPRVLREGEAFRIESPCCSRNVDPAGGVIDIALLQPCSSPGSGTGATRPHGWRLHARDHARAAWVLRHEGAPLDELLDLLCVDADRVFWP